MLKISVDNSQTDVCLQPNAKLSDLLDNLSSTLPPNRIITAIQLDGRQISKAAERQLLNSTLAEIEDISIRTSDKALWAANGVDICLTSVERVRRSLNRASELFRQADRNPKILNEATRYFSHCMEGIERFSESMLITRNVLNINFNFIEVDGVSLDTIERGLLSILEEIDEISDCPQTLADKIEDELIINLYQWSHGLKKIQRSLHSNS